MQRKRQKCEFIYLVAQFQMNIKLNTRKFSDLTMTTEPLATNVTTIHHNSERSWEVSGRRATQQYYHNTHRILLRCGKRPWRKHGKGMDRSDVLWTRRWYPNTSSSLVGHTRSGLSAPQQHRIRGQRLAERLGKLQFCGFFFLIGKFWIKPSEEVRLFVECWLLAAELDMKEEPCGCTSMKQLLKNLQNNYSLFFLKNNHVMSRWNMVESSVMFPWFFNSDREKW